MKELCLLLLFIVGSVAVPVYHGDRRFWTVVDSNGRSKVALHLAFVGDEKYIRGEVKVKSEDGALDVMMYLFQKCGRTERSDDYATGVIKGNELPLETIGRVCFKDADPFRQYGTNTEDNTMELQVSPGAFGCQAFLILVILLLYV
uniref:Uncharacterized protein n=1 Tax=Panagrolaimus sp. PS1159 TaxID=55785 RepID=A0AC35FS46_9BILA